MVYHPYGNFYVRYYELTEVSCLNVFRISVSYEISEFVEFKKGIIEVIFIDQA